MQSKSAPSKEMYILVGVPGGGKSSLGRRLGDAAVYQNQSFRVCSADDYHIDPADGQYKWKPENQKKAHEYCRNECLRSMEKSVDLIIIDNTNTTIAERQPYIDMANKFGYRIHTITVGTFSQAEINDCIRRGVHNVPAETVNNMKERIIGTIKRCSDG